jgi:tetratricopeptide (TPR) repeat protein
VRRYGEASELSLREKVAAALSYLASQLRFCSLRSNENRARYEDAARARYEEVVRRFGEAPELSLRKTVAQALYEVAKSLSDEGRYEEERACYEKLIHLYAEAPEQSLRENVAMSLIDLGALLWKQGQPDQARACCEQVVRRYGEAPEEMLKEQVAFAFNNLGGMLLEQGAVEEGRARYAEVLSRLKDESASSLRAQVARALIGLDDLLAVVRRFGEDPEEEVKEQVATALFGLALQRSDAKHFDRGRTHYEDLIRGYDEVPWPPLQALVAGARINLAAVWWGRQLDEPSTSLLKERLGLALALLGTMLGQQGHFEQAQARFDEVVRRFGTASDPSLRKVVGRALSEAGFFLLIEAKRCWQRKAPDAAQAMLSRAGEKLSVAQRLIPEDAHVLWHASYLAFLQGRKDEARSGLARALRVGGEELRSAMLENLQLQPLPADEELRAILRKLPTA